MPFSLRCCHFPLCLVDPLNSMTSPSAKAQNLINWSEKPLVFFPCQNKAISCDIGSSRRRLSRTAPRVAPASPTFCRTARNWPTSSPCEKAAPCSCGSCRCCRRRRQRPSTAASSPRTPTTCTGRRWPGTLNMPGKIMFVGTDGFVGKKCLECQTKAGNQECFENLKT